MNFSQKYMLKRPYIYTPSMNNHTVDAKEYNKHLLLATWSNLILMRGWKTWTAQNYIVLALCSWFVKLIDSNDASQKCICITFESPLKLLRTSDPCIFQSPDNIFRCHLSHSLIINDTKDGSVMAVVRLLDLSNLMRRSLSNNSLISLKGLFVFFYFWTSSLDGSSSLDDKYHLFFGVFVMN